MRRGRAILVGTDISKRVAILLQSSDGGASWEAGSKSAPGIALEPIQFLDELRSFIAGGLTAQRVQLFWIHA